MTNWVRFPQDQKRTTPPARHGSFYGPGGNPTGGSRRLSGHVGAQRSTGPLCFRSLCSLPPCSIPSRTKKGLPHSGNPFMDLAGIEPASESLSLEASPITATPFTFPHPAGEQRPSGFSSFIIRLQTQSFACIVSRNNDAGYRTYGCARADGCDYAATANSLSAFNFKNPVLSWSGPRMASSTSKPPSKPVQALVNKSLNSFAIKPQNSGQVNKPQV